MELVKALPAPTDKDSQLVYQGGGHDEPLEVLAPYHLLPGDDSDTGELLPASEYSLSIQLSREETKDGVRLSAEVTGNVGSLAYAWGAWPLDRGVNQFERLGESANVDLPPGAYNVVLDVEDRLTRAFARRQYLIYCGPAAPTDASEQSGG
jgi:hypothetical protein